MMYNIFLIKDPKYRVIMSQNIYDKVINHYIAKYILDSKLSKYLDNRNVATRKNMGSSYGIDLLLKYIEKLKRKNQVFYILKLDISKYFYSIDHNVLKSLLKDKLTNEEYNFLDIIISSTNEEYVNNFSEYFFNLTIEDKKENLNLLEMVINKYKNCESIFLEKITNDKLLEDYYKNLKTSESREHLLEVSVNLLSSDFNKQLENIFVYESSSERMKILISDHNSIYDYVLIINKMNKKIMKNKVVKEFIEIIKEKDNVTDEEIKLINSLNISDSDKEKLNEILNSKETINKELVGV